MIFFFIIFKKVNIINLQFNNSNTYSTQINKSNQIIKFLPQVEIKINNLSNSGIKKKKEENLS